MSAAAAYVACKQEGWLLYLADKVEAPDYVVADVSRARRRHGMLSCQTVDFSL